MLGSRLWFIWAHFLFFLLYYTISKIKRELKPVITAFVLILDYTIPKIKRELKHVYGYFRIFSHYTTLYAAYAKPISTFYELQNVNLAPYENYVLTNDIIEGDARAHGRDIYAGGAYAVGAQGARIY